MSIRLGLAVAAAVLAAPAFAAGAGSSGSVRGSDRSASTTPQAEIPFANLGGIYDWAADGTRGIYIQSLNRQWYYAKLFAPCTDLPFAVRVGFVTEPTSGSFDRFSSIVVRGEECQVESLTKSGPPPSKDERWRNRRNAHQADRGNGSPRSGASQGGASQSAAPR